MIKPENFTSEIFFLQSNQFDAAALDVFAYQYSNNSIYRDFCNYLHRTPQNVHSIAEIPFLPIEFFKDQKVVTGEWPEQKIFKSSGTTGQIRSRHYVKSIDFYHHITQHIFEKHYGPLSEFIIYALLPSYQEQGDSSLISMVDYFMSLADDRSQYFLHSQNQLVDELSHNSSKKILLIGVSYALLDLAEKIKLPPEQYLVMETGGMKGRRKEMIRTELHEILKASFHQNHIHSEYGMTELTSQAYGVDGLFTFPTWCKPMIRDVNDPLTTVGHGKVGGLNIIDLANIHSCAFLETKDLAKTHENGTFEVLGRFDNSDIRGCNLLINS